MDSALAAQIAPLTKRANGNDKRRWWIGHWQDTESGGIRFLYVMPNGDRYPFYFMRGKHTIDNLIAAGDAIYNLHETAFRINGG